MQFLKFSNDLKVRIHVDGKFISVKLQIKVYKQKLKMSPAANDNNSLFFYVNED